MGQDGRVAATASHDGRFEVFVQNSQGVHHFWQAPVTLKWTYYGQPYLPVSYSPTDISVVDPRSPDYRSTVVAGRDGAGRVMAAWISLGQVYYAAAPYPGSSLNLPGNLIYGLENVRSLALAQHDDGALEIFALDANGLVSSCRQQESGVWAWNGSVGWGNPDQFTFSRIAVGKLNGGLAMFGLVKTDSSTIFPVGAVVAFLESPTDANGGHSAYEYFEGNAIEALVAAESIDHRLELFALGSDAQLYHNYQIGSGATRGWGLLAGFETSAIASPIQVVVTGDGRMQAITNYSLKFGLNQPDNNFGLAICMQTQPNGGFASKFLQIGSVGEYGPTAVAMNSNGEAALFLYQTSGKQHPLTVRFATDQDPAWTYPQYVVDEIYG